MPRFTPRAFTSYVIAETMPCSRPVMTGLPRSLGSRAISHDAKKESPSTCKIARGNELCPPHVISVFAHDGGHHRFDTEGFARINGLVFRVGGFEIMLAALFACRERSRTAQGFHRVLAVYHRDDDLPRLVGSLALDDAHVTGMYARVYHRIALHLEDVGGFFVGHQVFVEIHDVEKLFLGRGRKSRFDDAEQPHASRELTGSEVAAFVFD